MGRFDDGDGSTFLAGLLLVAGVAAVLAVLRGARTITSRFGDLGLVGAFGLLLTAALTFGALEGAGVGTALLVAVIGGATSWVFFVLGERAQKVRAMEALGHRRQARQDT